MTDTIYPLSALRATVLHTQFLTAPNRAGPAPTPDSIVNLITNLGYLQIDTLHVVHRDHYVTLWARLGVYNVDDLHTLIYTAGERRLYEGWGHAASIIPLDHFRYHQWRRDSKLSFNPSFEEWSKKAGNRELVEKTLDRIRSQGGLRVTDFEDKSHKRADWYDWRPTKQALEALFAWGDLMVADRLNFHRVYDVRERVLPQWVDITPVDPATARRFCLEQAAKALGIFEARHLTFYAYMRATPARSMIKMLIKDGVLIEIQGESLSGARQWLVHRDNLPLLQRAADGEIKTERTTFLAPFDSLFWAGERDQNLWGFNQLLEAYKPAAQRVYGYFCFPILHKDRLVGRFDPKLDRQSNRMHLKAIYLEPEIEPDDALIADIADVLGDFLTWHGAHALEIEKSDPPIFAAKLLRAL